MRLSPRTIPKHSAVNFDLPAPRRQGRFTRLQHDCDTSMFAYSLSWITSNQPRPLTIVLWRTIDLSRDVWLITMIRERSPLHWHVVRQPLRQWCRRIGCLKKDLYIQLVYNSEIQRHQEPTADTAVLSSTFPTLSAVGRSWPTRCRRTSPKLCRSWLLSHTDDRAIVAMSRMSNTHLCITPPMQAPARTPLTE
jgi:hypothetical protein